VGGASGFFAARLAQVRNRHITLQPATRAPIASPGQFVARDQPDQPGQSGEVGQPRQGGDERQTDADGGPVERHPIPERLPQITLADGDGNRHPLSEWQGRPLMINFWATWCAPCRREIPLLKRVRHEHAAEGLEVVGIAVDFRDAVQRYAHDMRIDYPILVGEQDGLEAIAAFGMDTVFPFTAFADRQGRIVTLKVGELHADEADLILDRMRQVEQGRIGLAQARIAIASGIATLATRRAAVD
jgi:thiol-disulfide isomerase/thioredoxin